MSDSKERDAMLAICGLLGSGEQIIRAHAFPDNGTLAMLVKAGALVEHGVVESVWCDECDDGHFAALHRDPETERFGWICPQHGFIEAELEEIRQYRVDIDRVADSLADGVTSSSTKDFKLSPGFLWRIGHYPFKDRRVEILLVPRIRGLDELARIQDVTQKLPTPDLGLVLVADGLPLSGATLLNGYHVWPLAEVITIDSAGRLRFDEIELERAIRKHIPERLPPRPGRPSGIEATRVVYNELMNQGYERGRNATAREIEKRWTEVLPGEKPPSLVTIKKHVSEIRKEQ